MSGVLAGIVESWAGNPDLEGELVHVRSRPARGAITETIEPQLPPLLAARYAERGITELYRHQARAIDSIRAGPLSTVFANSS